MDRLRNGRGALSYANVMATVAVFIALGGVAGAVVKPLLDKSGSVKGRHIARGAVHMSDFAPSVRNKIEPPIPPANFTGQAADGSLRVKALIDFGPEGGTGDVLAMSATGDCAFTYQRGDWFDPGAGSPDADFTFQGFGAERPVVSVGFGFNGLFVGYVKIADSDKVCEGPVPLRPV